MKNKEIEVKNLYDLILEIANYIDMWWDEQREKELVKKGTKLMLSENLYMLKLIEYMMDSRLELFLK